MIGQVVGDEAAEGVGGRERCWKAQILKDLGCESGQGWNGIYAGGLEELLFR